jgi:hypothetical protein
MDGTGEHHLMQSQPGKEGQKSYVFPHMRTFDLKQIQ